MPPIGAENAPASSCSTTRGFEVRLPAYERYAQALAAKGIDAYLLRYFTAADAPAFDRSKTPQGKREAYEAARFDSWARRVSAVVTAILARSDSSGRIGVLGFSLGGYVAADAAARDSRIAALAVLYGGMPDAMVAGVRHLPPLIELHGNADHNVPFAKGEQLVKLGKAVGAEAELVAYPGKPHGFDFSDTDPMAADAIRRVVRFSKPGSTPAEFGAFNSSGGPFMRRGRRDIGVHDAVQGGSAGLAHHLRDDIARFLKVAGQRVELRARQPEQGKRHQHVISAISDIARRRASKGRKLHFGLLGAAYNIGIFARRADQGLVECRMQLRDFGLQAGDFVFESLAIGFQKMGERQMGGACVALFAEQMLRVPRPLAVDFEKLCGAQQMVGIAADRHQIGEAAQKPHQIFDFGNLRRGTHRMLGFPHPAG